ncbi:hypothetical protein F2P47_11120 [Parvibaculum sedimenti]|uniref:Uncharacterized protein n=1 Tax=Parvibaculum sedimenti TaxID=2608632 RepID=A0A6N6VJZ9_9HYPH|nr:hypothetical protein [Parvibaculum sedimenti]KAB7739627.1 hypothetical protein F2P47_11120 [Parvibaculum sedimenti]
MNVSSVAGATPALKKPEAMEAPGPEVGAKNDHDGDDGSSAAISSAAPRPGTGTVVNTSA